jgi:drug/metabolite transporter (DMT)-like permease
VIGLQTVPADRAAFLVQLTTVMVPLLSAITAGKLSSIPLQIWIACMIAFIGVIVMGGDNGGVESVAGNSSGISDTLSIDSIELSHGDFLIVMAALAYTLHVVRLGAYAPQTTPLKLAASKALTEAVLSVLLVAGLAYIGSTQFPSPEFVTQTGIGISEYFKTITSAFMDRSSISDESSFGVSIGAILWTGWVTCAYTIYAQSFGQKRVSPTESNIIYTTQPLFSSMFAFLLLGETLGWYGFVGATLIGTSLWLVSYSGDDS